MNTTFASGIAICSWFQAPIISHPGRRIRPEHRFGLCLRLTAAQNSREAPQENNEKVECHD
jgi:hypothetical protein